MRERHMAADVKRFEAALGDVLALLLRGYVTSRSDSIFTGFEHDDESPGMDTLHRAAVELLREHGALSGDAAFRYYIGELGDIFSEMLSMERVFYLTAEITIPAGGSIALSAAMVKPGRLTIKITVQTLTIDCLCFSNTTR